MLDIQNINILLNISNTTLRCKTISDEGTHYELIYQYLIDKNTIGIKLEKTPIEGDSSMYPIYFTIIHNTKSNQSWKFLIKKDYINTPYKFLEWISSKVDTLVKN
jgi:hypothetical protein